MADHQYVAWFRDHTARPEDQDYEWCACFLIAAGDGGEAQAWGDRLAADYSRRRDRREEFIRSCLALDPWPAGSVPRVVAGELASDEAIGW